MPRGDGTGPMGAGPMTGRGAGFCAGLGVPGFANRGPGLGFGRGRGGSGGGRGWRNMYYATGLTGRQRAAQNLPTGNQEVEMLRRQAALLEEQLVGIKQRIDELAAQGTAQ